MAGVDQTVAAFPAHAGEASFTLEPVDQQAILDNLPALIAYWDADLRNRLANSAYVEYFGMTPQQIFGRHISELLGDELYRKNLPYLERALAGERQEFDREIPTPSGPRYTQAVYLPDLRNGTVHGIFVLVTDVSARHAAEIAVAKAEARFRTLFQQAPSATLLKDVDGVIVAANSAAASFFGYTIDQLIGMATADLLEPEDVPSADLARDQLFTGRTERFSQERRYRHADGHHVWAQVEATLVPGDGPTPHILVQMQDVSARKTYQRELEHLATHDALTGLFNRRGIAQEFQRQSQKAGATGTAGSILICDLDRFKQVNDSLGHDVGDELLAHVAQILSRTVRAIDTVGRLGGDEFAVILSGEDLDEATKVAARINENLASANSSRPWADVGVSMSIGAAEFSSSDSLEEAMRTADRKMFDAKAARHGTERRRDRGTGA